MRVPTAERRIVAAMFVPVLLVAFAILWFAPQCEDDFCPALLTEIGVAFVMLVLLLVGSFLALRRRLRPGRAALASWTLALALGSAVFGTSQWVERDVPTAWTAFALAALLLIAFWAFARRRTHDAGPARGEGPELGNP